MKVNLDDLTLGQLKKVGSFCSDLGSDLVYDDYIGKTVMFMCVNYFYEGTVVGVTKDTIVLDDASIVYETGDWKEKNYSDIQKLPSLIHVQKHAIESFGLYKSKLITV